MVIPSETAKLLTASNWMLVLASLTVAVVYSHRVLKGHFSGAAKKIAIGVVWVAGGLVVHRLFWAVHKAAVAMGNEPLAKYFWNNAWLTLFPMAAIVLGYGHHMEPVLQTMFGKHYMAKYIAMASVIYFGIYWFFVYLYK